MNKIQLYVLAFLAFFLSGCIKNFFVPDKNIRTTPDAYSILYTDQFIKSSKDNTQLHAWILKPRKQPLGTFIYLQGNADNIGTHLPQVYWLAEAGYRVVMIEYRGFGLSEGEASTENTVLDVQDWIIWTVQNTEFHATPIFLFGQSTGGALALSALSQSDHQSRIAGVISEGAFADYKLIAQELMAKHLLTWPFQWIPALSVDNRYAPRATISDINSVPLLIIHSRGDKKIPLHHAEQLYETAKEPKRLWLLDDYPHMKIMIDPKNRPEFLEHIEWMKNVCAQ